MDKVLKAYDAWQEAEILSADRIVNAVEADIAPRGARGNVTGQHEDGISTYEDARKAEDEFFKEFAYQ